MSEQDLPEGTVTVLFADEEGRARGMAEFRLDLRSTISTWPDFAEQNITNLGDGWKIAEEMAQLHAIALQRISRAVVPHPSQQDEGTLLLGAHGLNLFLEFMGLVIRGRFDVASHLVRAILDCQSLSVLVIRCPK
jgi:hypothetical protein